jgi:hypothetical protein
VISLRFHMLAIPLSPPAPARRRDETHRRCRRRHRRALRGTRAPQHILAVTYFMIRADNSMNRNVGESQPPRRFGS